ncbi:MULTISPECIES: hypothetical protein [unclassified Corallococcus]|uniref:hypothetical protein n=1 Tax=unclassified Corallococcus TaxID=2685029 RepID=UPI001A8CA856|nr:MULTISPECIES: hypothetical protein [unclassified Corallococcus]MBN9688003.1 hypothetical protein [Corallococcus sp. NCSPR001]WAS88187.1 hypothetical protein O0N60_14670 [Corallococcus sp. NCRR]
MSCLAAVFSKDRVMNWSVYADLSRPLTEVERRAVADVLDEVVPDSGCVGPQKGDVDEVYFRVDAASSAEASATAARLLDVILEKAGVQVRYELQLQPGP